MAHVGIQGLAAGHGQHHRAKDQHSVNAVAKEERSAMVRRQGPEDFGPLGNVIHPQHGQRYEPHCHHRSEELADAPGAAPLDGEQGHQNGARQRQHGRLEVLTCLRQAFHGAQHRDRRRDHAVAIQERSADHRQQGHGGHLARFLGCRSKALGNDGKQGEDAALAVVVGAHDEAEVLDRHHHDQRPEHERQDAEQIAHRSVGAARAEQALLQRVQGAGADVAKHNPERAQTQSRQPRPVVAMGRAGHGDRRQRCGRAGDQVLKSSISPVRAVEHSLYSQGTADAIPLVMRRQASRRRQVVLRRRAGVEK